VVLQPLQGQETHKKVSLFGVVWLNSVGGNMIPQKMPVATGQVADT